jgi:hypothetical protein
LQKIISDGDRRVQFVQNVHKIRNLPIAASAFTRR